MDHHDRAKPRLLGLLVLGVLASLVPSTASAGTISYYLQTFNVPGGTKYDPTGNYAQITLTADDSGAGTVSFQITTNFVSSKDTGALLTDVGFNLASAFDSLVSGAFTVTTTNPVLATYSAVKGSQNFDGYGDFQWALTPPNNSEAVRVTSESFTINNVNTLLGNTTWDDGPNWVSNIFVYNDNGSNPDSLFAAKYFPSGGAATGFIDGASTLIFTPPPPPAPEPSTIVLAAMGLGGAFGLRRFRKSPT